MTTIIYVNQGITSLQDIPLRTAKVDTLDLSNNRITSLDGIERFPHLINLTLACNPLTSLSGIEKCPNLVYLNCNGAQLKTLEHLFTCKKLRTIFALNNRLVSAKGIPFKTKNIFIGGNNFPPNHDIERDIRIHGFRLGILILEKHYREASARKVQRLWFKYYYNDLLWYRNTKINRLCHYDFTKSS